MKNRVRHGGKTGQSQCSIEYVSTYPGAGKTHAAISMMVKHMTGFGEGIIFYCAPSHNLIEQTLDGLYKAADNDDLLDGRVFYAQEVKTSAELSEATNVVPGTRPRTLISVQVDTIMSMIERGEMNGCVLMLTHSAFLAIRARAALKHITLLFDESNTWITLKGDLRLDGGMEKLAKKLFKIIPFRNENERPLGDDEDYDFLEDKDDKRKDVQLLRPRFIDPDELETLHEKFLEPASSEHFKAAVNLYKSLMPDEDNPDVYRTISYCILKDSNKRGVKSLFTVTLPHHAFVSYKRVIILCANFDKSQMYHLLRRYNVRCENITDPFMREHVGEERYDRRVAAIKARYREVVLGYLVNSDKMPSRYMFDDGVLVKSEAYEAYIEHLKAMNHGGQPDTEVLKAVVAKPNSNNKKRARRPTGRRSEKPDVYHWMISEAQKMAARWQSKFGRHGDPVLFYNYSRVWHKPEGMEVAKHGDIIGMNHFADRNVVAFIMSTNPGNDERAVLDVVLGDGYDCHMDYTVTKAIQCLGRANVRNTKSKEKMLVILPTSGLAEMIYDQLDSLPRLMRGYPSNIERVELVEARKATGNKPGVNHRQSISWTSKLTPADYKSYRSKLSMLSRARRNGDTARMEVIEAEIKTLKQGVEKQ